MGGGSETRTRKPLSRRRFSRPVPYHSVHPSLARPSKTKLLAEAPKAPILSVKLQAQRPLLYYAKKGNSSFGASLGGFFG